MRNRSILGIPRRVIEQDLGSQCELVPFLAVRMAKENKLSRREFVLPQPSIRSFGCLYHEGPYLVIRLPLYLYHCMFWYGITPFPVCSYYFRLITMYLQHKVQLTQPHPPLIPQLFQQLEEQLVTALLATILRVNK